MVLTPRESVCRACAFRTDPWSPFMNVMDSVLKIWGTEWLEATPAFRDASEGGRARQTR